jgi:hypothetical protein
MGFGLSLGYFYPRSILFILARVGRNKIAPNVN